MMAAKAKRLADEDARKLALTAHDRSLLVEAGAGSGKTAVMAGRIALMLAAGIAPKAIAAVTFTEFAASELLARIRDYVEALLAGGVPVELDCVLAGGVDAAERANLEQANRELDEITCSTIHGFCQRLVKPYPVEANIDPGAAVMDRGEADLLFSDLQDSWLRERLSENDGSLLAEMVSFDPDATVALIATVAGALRGRRDVGVPPAQPVEPAAKGFREAVARFGKFLKAARVAEPETTGILVAFETMASALKGKPDSAANLVQIVTAAAEASLCKKDGDFLVYKKKGKWVEAAKQAGLSKSDGERLSDEAAKHYEACCGSWNTMRSRAAATILAELVTDIRPLIARFQDEKRRRALLDFDDLIFAACDLLRHHGAVREALAKRYRHVLVDEFQDTDPVQAEIFWRLAGDPPGKAAKAWTEFRIRPGALFLVGDPKQAIYRFRGADVNAYLRARDLIRKRFPENVIAISTNFRSCASILAYVNQRFREILSAEGQPGFTALDHFHEDDHAPCVAALDVRIPETEGKAKADLLRNCEAEDVAEFCSRMIGRGLIRDRKSGERRVCRAGDIALLAPTGADLWRYEEALEARQIPVSTQAGKGFYRRQEVQDLIALTRVLADGRDRLALGALLRGPLVGLSEEELLDIIWALPRPEGEADRVPRLDRSIEPQNVNHALAREVLTRIQSLARRANATTPHDLLSQAVDVLRVRPLLVARYGGRADRALANLDLFLELARTYSVRGLRAFAEAMTAAWNDETKTVEGRPDAQEEAVCLYTMHAAKGLEWPIVIPINGLTHINEGQSAVIDRDAGHLHCPVFGVWPDGYEDARTAEKSESERERVRLWYVATTRAREFLVIPRFPDLPRAKSWLGLVDLSIAELPAIDLETLPAGVPTQPGGVANAQTREVFAAEAGAIAAKQKAMRWVAPSRDEEAEGAVIVAEEPRILAPEAASETGEPPVPVQGGRERGLIIHKLFEEVLNGEVSDDSAALSGRARVLIESLGLRPVANPEVGLAPDEIASCLIRGLSVDEIAASRMKLVPECPIYSSWVAENAETIMFGIADAVSISENGADFIVDWKSDVAPDPDAIAHYREQVTRYLEVTGIASGLIVFVTSGAVTRVNLRQIA